MWNNVNIRCLVHSTHCVCTSFGRHLHTNRIGFLCILNLSNQPSDSMFLPSNQPFLWNDVPSHSIVLIFDKCNTFPCTLNAILCKYMQNSNIIFAYQKQLGYIALRLCFTNGFCTSYKRCVCLYIYVCSSTYWTSIYNQFKLQLYKASMRASERIKHIMGKIVGYRCVGCIFYMFGNDAFKQCCILRLLCFMLEFVIFKPEKNCS